MTTLVTGGTGFVGSALIRRLLERGEAVRALVRRGSDRRNLAGLDIDLIEADLTDASTLSAASRGVRSVYHAAADYRLWVRDPSRMYRTNVDGTVALLRLAAEAGATRIVYTSSVATLGLPGDASPGTEQTPVCLRDMIGHYKRSKYLGEQAVQVLARDEGLPIVIVNPSTPIGPRDIKPTPTGRLVLDAAAGRIPAYVETGLNIVHVEDVADGHLLAHDRGQIGERYVLGGENMLLRDLLCEIARLSGRRAPSVKLSPSMVLPVAYVVELIARLSGRAPLVTVDGVRLARKHMFFSHARAENELGYRPRPAVSAIADALDWYRRERML